MTNWKNIHSNFTKDLQREWENLGFSYEECKSWIEVGLKPNDADYAWWVKSIRNKDPEQYDNEQELSEEYKGISIEVINQIKEFEHSYYDPPSYIDGLEVKFSKLTSEQEWFKTIDQQTDLLQEQQIQAQVEIPVK